MSHVVKKNENTKAQVMTPEKERQYIGKKHSNDSRKVQRSIPKKQTIHWSQKAKDVIIG